MAYTSIIPVSRLDNSITYIRNKDKTTKKGQSAGSLEEAIDYAMNPQEALDAPRIQWIGGKKLQIEREAGEAIAEQLRAMGHEVEIADDRTAMGRGEIIWKCENGVYAAGTEPRCDGTVASW